MTFMLSAARSLDGHQLVVVIIIPIFVRPCANALYMYTIHHQTLYSLRSIVRLHTMYSVYCAPLDKSNAV